MALTVPGVARAEQFFVLYSDSGIGWRIGQHDREMERRQVELNYAQDVLNAKDDYNAAVDAANQGNDQQEMLLAASQRLQSDLQAAEDRRIAAMDALYPTRWDEISNYPDLILVGYGGPYHFCSLDIEGGALAWLSYFLPYPGYSKPCLFGWNYGARHQFGDVRIARANYRTRYEANLRLHPSTPADLAFHNANRFVQTKNRSNQGHTQSGDVTFMSKNHLPPARVNPPSIPRAAVHTPIQRGGTGAPPSYVPRATVPRATGPTGRGTAGGNSAGSAGRGNPVKPSGGRGASSSGGRGGSSGRSSSGGGKGKGR